MSERRNRSADGATTPVRDEDEAGFVGRWSRRKQALRRGQELPEEAAPSPAGRQGVAPQPEGCDGEPEAKIDPRTGKPFDELTDADMPPLESIGPDSDLSAFMAKNISPGLRMKALTRVFHTAKYNKVCLCAEYAEDYTNFVPMGDIVPHDLKAAIVREAGKLKARLKEKGLALSDEDAETRIARELRGEKLPDIEELAETTARQELEQAEEERPSSLHS